MAKLPDEIKAMLNGLLKKKIEESPKKVVGTLTDSEKVAYLELDDLRESIRKLEAKLDTKKKLFWASIESRLEIYDRPLSINTKTGEISTSEIDPKGFIDSLLEGIPGGGCDCPECSTGNEDE